MSANIAGFLGLLVGFLVVGVIGVVVGDQMVTAANQSVSESSPALAQQQRTIIETFSLGVTICKISIIVSVSGIVFLLLSQMAVIGTGSADTRPEPQPSQYREPLLRTNSPATRQQPVSMPERQTVTVSELPSEHAYTNPFADERISDKHLPENQYHNRFEAILDNESELESKDT